MIWRSRTDVADSRRRWIAREVRDVAVSFNRMADRVEAMVRGQRELLGAISHELRSPLGRARVALEIARDRLPPEAGERSPKAALDDVETQLGAVDSVLGDLLDVTRAGLADLRKENRGIVEWIRGRIAEEPQPPAIVLCVPDGGEDPRSPSIRFSLRASCTTCWSTPGRTATRPTRPSRSTCRSSRAKERPAGGRGSSSAIVDRASLLASPSGRSSPS